MSCPMRLADSGSSRDIAVRSRRGSIAIVLFQRLAEPRQAAQGRLEVMGDGIRERLELPVGLLQLPGALLHPLLQLDGVPPDLLVEARLRDGDGELGRDFLRDADHLLRKRPPLARRC